MANTVLVPNSTQNEYKESSPSTKFKNFIIKLPRRISSVHSDMKVNPNRLVGFQQQLEAKGISRRTTKVLTNARRKETQSNYQVDPFRYPLNFVLDSLVHLYQLDTHIRPQASIGQPYQLSTVMIFRLLLEKTPLLRTL